MLYKIFQKTQVIMCTIFQFSQAMISFSHQKKLFKGFLRPHLKYLFVF